MCVCVTWTKWRLTTLDVYFEGIRPFNVDFSSTLYPLILHSQMFFIPASRNAIKSSSVKQLEISPVTNQALVTYNNGNQYLYSNIDEDALFDVMFNNVQSFGKWVNAVCKADGVSCFPISA